jgi:FAD:protein FMN transferase
MIFRSTALLFVVVAVISGTNIASSPQQSKLIKYQEARRLMWAQFEIVAFGSDRARLASAAGAAFEEIERLDNQMSNYSDASELTYINRNAARQDVIVEKELFDFLKTSVDYSKKTDGAFDITVGPLMRAWGFFDSQGRVPGTDELRSVMDRVGYKHVIFDDRRHTIRFDREGVELDLGGIAKGYAVDRAAEILKTSGVSSAFITCGSSIRAIGAAEGQAGWRVEVTDPTDRSRHLESLDIKDQAISTSACREKTFESDGKKYCHIMDPRTGRPIHQVISATIIADSGVEAEVLSKAVMVLTFDESQKLLKSRPSAKALICYWVFDALGCERMNF